MALTTICSSSPIHSSPPIFSPTTTTSLKSIRSLQLPSTSPHPPPTQSASNLVSHEGTTFAIAVATKELTLEREIFWVLREAVALTTGAEATWTDSDGESREGVVVRGTIGDLRARRKKRRRRINGFEFLEVEKEEEERGGDGEVGSSGFVNSERLSPAEEAELSQCLKDLARLEAARKRIAEAQKHNPSTRQLAKALRMKKRSVDRILWKGRESREKIICSYRSLVVSVATGYQGKGLSLQDLIQEGSIGLLRGAGRFDPGRGYKLSTYVYWWIREAIMTALSDKSRIVRLPKRMWDKVAKVVEADNALRQRLRRLPSHEEIAEVLNLNVSTVRLVHQRSKSPVSLDHAIAGQDSLTLQEITPGPDETVPEKIVRKQLMKQELEKILQTLLTKREAHILRLHFGLYGQTPQSCDEIGRLLKLSRERIRQIKVLSMSKLRQINDLDDFKEDVV